MEVLEGALEDGKGGVVVVVLESMLLELLGTVVQAAWDMF
jgi:hypothetical protein